jgi:hypothetical protein
MTSMSERPAGGRRCGGVMGKSVSATLIVRMGSAVTADRDRA